MVQSDTKYLPHVSIIIACLNEEKHISQCLDSILQQGYPREKIEVLVVDGMSRDATRQIITDQYSKYTFIRLLDNPQRITPAAFNTGIRAAGGEIILIMGAHSTYEKNYVSMCVTHLMESDADNVGGVCKVIPGAVTWTAQCIALALCCPFGVGNSYFRIGSKVPRCVDTVFGGCYRRELFDKIGFFDTDLVRGQDTEFNARLIRAGGKILLVPEIISYYAARESLSKLARMQWQYGRFKPLVIQKVGRVFTVRQVIAPLFVAALVLLPVLGLWSTVFLSVFGSMFGIYAAVSLVFSLLLAYRQGWPCLFLLPMIFFVIHISWGSGFLRGLWDTFILHKGGCVRPQDVPVTR